MCFDLTHSVNEFLICLRFDPPCTHEAGGMRFQNRPHQKRESEVLTLIIPSTIWKKYCRMFYSLASYFLAIPVPQLVVSSVSEPKTTAFAGPVVQNLAR